MPITTIKTLHAKLDQAIILAAEKHCGQLDKCGRPDILHPLRVLSNIKPDPGMTENDFILSQIVAVLHDVVEDCDVTFDEILQRFGKRVLVAVSNITKRVDESYVEYLKRVRSDPISLVVKKWDIMDNMSLDRNGQYTKLHCEKRDVDRIKKYREALNYLNGFTIYI